MVGHERLHHARQRRFDRIGHENPAVELRGRALPAFGRNGIVPQAVEILPPRANHLRTRVLGQGIARRDVLGPGGHERTVGGLPCLFGHGGAGGKGQQAARKERSGGILGWGLRTGSALPRGFAALPAQVADFSWPLPRLAVHFHLLAILHGFAAGADAGLGDRLPVGEWFGDFGIRGSQFIEAHGHALPVPGAFQFFDHGVIDGRLAGSNAPQALQLNLTTSVLSVRI